MIDQPLETKRPLLPTIRRLLFMKLPSLPDDVASRNVRDNGAQIMMTLEMLKHLDWTEDFRTHTELDGDYW